MRLVDHSRLRLPADHLTLGFPALRAADPYTFHTNGEPVLLTDPTYLTDFYNTDNEVSRWIRQHGVVVMDFGGDVGGPAWLNDPDLLVPIAMIYGDEGPVRPVGAKELAAHVGCDSGSFVFLPVPDAIPKSVYTAVNIVLKDNTGAILEDLPSGTWHVYYEQWEPVGGMPASSYRNIAAVRAYYPCPCCGHTTLPEKPTGTYFICPECGWEDDNVQFNDIDFPFGANRVSLRQARLNYLATGVCEPRKQALKDEDAG